MIGWRLARSPERSSARPRGALLTSSFGGRCLLNKADLRYASSLLLTLQFIQQTIQEKEGQHGQIPQASYTGY